MNTPNVSIFIRTYHGDAEWLRYCLRSIHLNLSGWSELVVCIPRGQEACIRPMITDERVVTCEPFDDDYIGQQVSKLQAHRYVSGDYVLFVDSDVVFRPGSSVKNFFSAGLPVIGKERYDELSFPPARCWQPVVEKLFGETPEWEYMRGTGVFLFRTDTLKAFAISFPEIEQYGRAQPYRSFSEYNFLGFFIDKTRATEYCLVDLNRQKLPPAEHLCFWSWDGITPEVFAQLVAVGVADPLHPPDFKKRPLPPGSPKPFGPWKRFRYAIKSFFRG